MALPSAIVRALCFVLFLAQFDFSLCLLVKGSISCLDCTPNHDFSGVKVAVKCAHEKRFVSALTNDKGYFEVEIPSDSSPPSSPSPNCLATLLGGPEQLYSLKKAFPFKINKAGGSDSYTLSTPLTFLSKYPSKAELQKLKKITAAEKAHGFESLKTINLPLPPEWGLAPSSYYYRFFPIIGIP